MNKISFEINCFLRKKQLDKLLNNLKKSQKKLLKTKKERIWIENNPQIHILNYPFYKLKKSFIYLRKNYGTTIFVILYFIISAIWSILAYESYSISFISIIYLTIITGILFFIFVPKNARCLKMKANKQR